jgi:hypothetical protein
VLRSRSRVRSRGGEWPESARPSRSPRGRRRSAIHPLLPISRTIKDGPPSTQSGHPPTCSGLLAGWGLEAIIRSCVIGWRGVAISGSSPDELLRAPRPASWPVSMSLPRTLSCSAQMRTCRNAAGENAAGPGDIWWAPFDRLTRSSSSVGRVRSRLPAKTPVARTG